MQQSTQDTYVRSQGVYRLEFLEFQVSQDQAFQENNLSLEQLIHIASQDGYEELKNMLNEWFEHSKIYPEDVMEYMFMNAYPELFEHIDAH